VLTPRQQRFVEEFLVDLNGTQAAIRAGYSAKTANEQAARLLTNVNVQTAVAEGRQELSRRTEIRGDKVMAELASLAFYDPGEIGRYPMNGPEDIETLPEHLRRAVVGWSWDQKGRFIPKLASKISALELIGRYFDMWSGKQPPLDERDQHQEEQDREARRAALRREFHSLLALRARMVAEGREIEDGPQPARIAAGSRERLTPGDRPIGSVQVA
jgi:phage terminase small subunit